jgi:hypothetical protein
VELLRAKADISGLRRHNAELDMRLRQAHEFEVQLEAIISDKKGEIERLNNEAIEENRRYVDSLRMERGKAMRALTRAEKRNKRQTADLANAGKTNLELLQQIRNQECQRIQISDQLINSQALVANEKQMVKQTRLSYAAAMEKLLLAEQKHKEKIRCFVTALTFMYRLSRYLAGRLAPTVRSKATLLLQWRAVSSQKVQSQRRLVCALSTNEHLKLQLDAQELRIQELQQLAQDWQQKYTKSIEAREKAGKKFIVYIRRTKGRSNTTTTRLLTGLLFLWRLNLVLSAQLGLRRRSPRAIESALEATCLTPAGLHMIEEVSEPSGSRTSLASLAETADGDVTTISGGLGFTLGSPHRITSNVFVQTEEEHTTPLNQQEIHKSRAVDTADIRPTTADASVMTDIDPEEAVLRERIAKLNKTFNTVETIDPVSLRHPVKKDQSSTPNADSPQNESPRLGNRLPFVGRIGVPIIPSEVREPFVPHTQAQRRPQPAGQVRRLGNQAVQGRIFTQPLENVPFPLPAFSKVGGPSTPSTPVTPTPSSMIGRRQPFLLSPGNCSFN